MTYHIGPSHIRPNAAQLPRSSSGDSEAVAEVLRTSGLRTERLLGQVLQSLRALSVTTAARPQPAHDPTAVRGESATVEGLVERLVDEITKVTPRMGSIGGLGPLLPSAVGLQDTGTNEKLRVVDGAAHVVLQSTRDEARFDYGARTDSNPVYVGRAAQGTATSEPWVVTRFDYDVSGRPSRIQVLTGSWTDRDGLGWT